MITNIRYGEPGKIMFDYKGQTVTIAEPTDVLLVGWPGADNWIRENYGYLLAHL